MFVLYTYLLKNELSEDTSQILTVFIDTSNTMITDIAADLLLRNQLYHFIIYGIIIASMSLLYINKSYEAM